MMELGLSHQYYQIWTSIWILLLKKRKARKTSYGFCANISTKKNKILVAEQDLISKPGGKI